MNSVTIKSGWATIVTAMGTLTGSIFGWFDENITKLSLFAGFIFTITMIFNTLMSARKTHLETKLIQRRLDDEREEAE